MKLLILGGGGREHALAAVLGQQQAGAEIVVAPGNGGTERAFRNAALRLEDRAAVLALARAECPDLIIVGPEAPLVAGVADELVAHGFAVFGPGARAAAIEGSKVFAKELMLAHGVPTAAFEVHENPDAAVAEAARGLFPKVVKADGLAAGKGAIVVHTPAEASDAVRVLMDPAAFGLAGRRVVVESFLTGEEASAFAICRDEQFLLLPVSQDHKRIGEGDTGPNTGGMGAYCPVPLATPELLARVRTEVFAPVLRALAAAGRPFRGLLYAGLMVDGGRPSVVEFNCRFGDPETQALVPLLGPAFLPALFWSATGVGDSVALERELADAAADRASATVVLAAAGYPGPYETGQRIEGMEAAAALPDTWVFHAGTKRAGDHYVTTGGRVAAVTGVGPDLRAALARAYEGVSLVRFPGRTFRRDIGHRALAVVASAQGLRAGDGPRAETPRRKG